MSLRPVATPMSRHSHSFGLQLPKRMIRPLSRDVLETRISLREQWLSECCDHLRVVQTAKRESRIELEQYIAHRVLGLSAQLEELYKQLHDLRWL
jgi:hypothetical protein